jgi:hypothetical protein
MSNAEEIINNLLAMSWAELRPDEKVKIAHKILKRVYIEYYKDIDEDDVDYEFSHELEHILDDFDMAFFDLEEDN